MPIGKLLTALFFAVNGVATSAQVITPKTDTFPLGLPPFIAGESFTKSKIEFGEFLFSSKVLSRDGTVACISCHNPAMGFSQNSQFSIGVFGRRGARNSPSLLNLYASSSVMYDGRAQLERQPLLPLENPNEMDVFWPTALKLVSRFEATKRFLESEGLQRLTKDEIISSLSGYVRSLVSGGSRFDKYYYEHVDSALSATEKMGLRLFTGKANCSSCHLLSGGHSLFTDGSFHALGVGYKGSSYADKGLGRITGSSIDEGKFKTPSLRNVADTAPYMHDGSLSSLKVVIEFYNKGGVKGAKNKDRKISPLDLTKEEMDALVAFMGSLSTPTVQYAPWLSERQLTGRSSGPPSAAAELKR